MHWHRSSCTVKCVAKRYLKSNLVIYYPKMEITLVILRSVHLIHEYWLVESWTRRESHDVLSNRGWLKKFLKTALTTVAGLSIPVWPHSNNLRLFHCYSLSLLSFHTSEAFCVMDLGTSRPTCSYYSPSLPLIILKNVSRLMINPGEGKKCLWEH